MHQILKLAFKNTLCPEYSRVISKNHLKLPKSKFVRKFSACPSPWKTVPLKIWQRPRAFTWKLFVNVTLSVYNFYGENKLMEFREYYRSIKTQIFSTKLRLPVRWRVIGMPKFVHKRDISYLLLKQFRTQHMLSTFVESKRETTGSPWPCACVSRFLHALKHNGYCMYHLI
jgi:hypothetical protein